ncbi:MAG: beta-glucosidase [Clostridiales bacterium]|nr:beta-glucosidase [Clostridiales bacterium]
MARYFASRSNEISERETSHLKLVRELAAQCMVLLENDGTLPLKADNRNIALFGNGARRTVKGGTGSGEVNSRTAVNIEQGLEEAGFKVTTKSWLAEFDRLADKKYEEFMAALEARAKEKSVPVFTMLFDNPFKEPPVQAITSADIEASAADTAIYVLARNSGEGADRYNSKGDYQLFDEEVEALKLLGKEYGKLILVLNIGGVIDTTALKGIAGINAVLLAGQNGSVGGNAVADVLTGRVSPSGKLADTWAASYEDYPSSATFSHNNGNLDDEYYTEGIYVGYRYFDTFNIKPNYCFGYGLSYTDFETIVTGVSADEELISVSVDVRNTGMVYSGREVVQVYFSAPSGKLEKPCQQLAGFAKTGLLEPGQQQSLKITFNTSSMSSYSEAEAAWIMEPGEYHIRVGNSSRNTRVAAVISLDSEAVTEKLTNLFHDSEKLDLISSVGIEPYAFEEAPVTPVLSLKASKIRKKVVGYNTDRPVYEDNNPGIRLTMEDVLKGKASLGELVAQLTVAEMAEICVGTLRLDDEADAGAIIGSASSNVPGAAGDTTSILMDDRKIGNMILADGPAGLRLTPHFQTTLDGGFISDGNSFPGGSAKELEPSTDKIDYYQYCTAVPIAWMLSQSWDMELVESAGRLIGAEMLEFHVTLWLAPGMNIHRNPLCGRNFEYYSEDPLLSGLCAAAATEGVQSHPGIGTTIKHFAANSQEDNRMFNNAHISERALREIYLKGFEIAVKSAHPMSIMTSYNLINGVHAANSFDLLTSAAREEWGFDGFVMTDWFTSQDTGFLFGEASHKYPSSSSVLCIRAGNDLQMPGCRKNVQDIIDAVGDGSLPLGELQACALNILRVLSLSNCYDGAKPYSKR